VEAINAAGGVKGRKIDIVMRDTQGDHQGGQRHQELISQAKVHAIWDRSIRRGASTTPIMARARFRISILAWSKPDRSLRNFPMRSAWRLRTANGMTPFGNYCLNILKAKKVP